VHRAPRASRLCPAAILLLTAASPLRPQSLPVRVDPRLELLGVVQLLAGNAPTATDLRFPYRARVEARFGGFREHPAVQMLRRLGPRGLAFDAPVIALLHCSAPPALAPTTPTPEAIVRRAGGADTLAAWLQALRDFAAASRFQAFMDSNRAYHAQLERAVTALLAPDLVPRLEAYYGMREDGYEIILSPLTKGGFGPRLEVAPGRWQLVAVASPSRADGDSLVFFSADGLRSLVWHEFAHSFVNPLTEAHWAELAPLGGLLDSIAPGLPQWYREWKPALDEHIVRAAAARMVALYRGTGQGRAAIEREVGWGFVYVPAIAEALENYEHDRARWPDFGAFFPRLVAVVDSLAAAHHVPALTGSP